MTQRETASTDGITSEPVDGGWTNEYVRDGYEVDGAESRLHPLGMDSRIRLAQAQYAVFAGAVGDARAVYPAIRLLGTLLGREGTAEQWIAESEYVIHHGSDIDRAGIGTRRWWLGLAYSLVVWATMGALGIGVAVVVVLALPGFLSSILGVPQGTARTWSALILILIGTVGLAWLVLRVARTTDI